MTTVHPDNVFSSNNMIKYGMKKVSQKKFKRGLRDIYFKELDWLWIISTSNSAFLWAKLDKNRVFTYNIGNI